MGVCILHFYIDMSQFIVLSSEKDLLCSRAISHMLIGCSVAYTKYISCEWEYVAGN